MTLADFARVLAMCTKCGKRGGHHSVLNVVQCTCGNAWHAAVPMAFDTTVEAAPKPAPSPLVMDGPAVLEVA